MDNKQIISELENYLYNLKVKRENCTIEILKLRAVEESLFTTYNDIEDYIEKFKQSQEVLF